MMMRVGMSDDLHMGKIVLQGALFGLYFTWRDYARARKAKRTAEGRPSWTERVGWHAANLFWRVRGH
jgi:hypothetical protein